VTQETVTTEEAAVPAETDEEETSEVVPKFRPVRFHDKCIVRLEAAFKETLVKRTRSTYASPDGKTRVICAVSKQHDFYGDESYWFAFHPYYFEFLKGAERPFAAFGCGSEQKLFLFPAIDLEPWLSGAYVTNRNDRFYWHVQLYREGDRWWFKRRQEKGNLEVTRYLLPLSPQSPING
jgi:hypothetical protein